jgi:predicted nuclease of predicted toxin-antitoxin system
VTFLADEGVDRQIVERLRLDGYEVAYVAEMSPGMADEIVLTESRNSASVLITADKDFGELVFRRRQASSGVLLVRLWGLKSAMKASVVSAAIREHAQELPGAFAVPTPGNIRIRRGLQRQAGKTMVWISIP